MDFLCEGKAYAVTDLKVFDTGDEVVPRVYVTRDLRCVFVQTVDPYKGPRVHRADPVEIKSLAARFNIPDLLRAR
jgi:hypothetical protein